jgi:hypothetical protein
MQNHQLENYASRHKLLSSIPKNDFKKPEPLPPNENRLVDAFEMPDTCVPHHRLDNLTSDWKEFSEDCLYLNIFVPHQNVKADLLKNNAKNLGTKIIADYGYHLHRRIRISINATLQRL